MFRNNFTHNDVRKINTKSDENSLVGNQIYNSLCACYCYYRFVNINRLLTYIIRYDQKNNAILQFKYNQLVV